jgi:hypothetical protein
MSPDIARDKMGKDSVWLMRDWVPNDLGSQLESRSPWSYSTNGPLNGPIRTMKWVNTQGLSHHIAVTATSVYNLDTPNAPRVVSAITGGGNPLASLYEFVCVPRSDDTLPLFFKYDQGATTETILTTDPTTPKGKFVAPWLSYFVLANSVQYPSRLFWLEQEFARTPGTFTTPAYDPKAWLDTSNDITALTRTRTSLLVFHTAGVERMRGGIPPGTNRDDDLWLESMSDDIGCPFPQSIVHWNDNVLFCDTRGAYITDGTQIKSLTQGAISRAWQARGQTPTLRLSSGIWSDFWVVTALRTDTGAFIDCWVCYLPTRKWFTFTNVPCSSFVTATPERLYGGTWDGKVIDCSHMWDEADPLTDSIDGNAVAVLPSLETAYFTLTNGSVTRKRAKDVFLNYDMDEAAGGLNLYACEQAQPDTNNPYLLLKTFRSADQDAILPVRDARSQVRRKAPLGLSAFGYSFKLQATGTLRNLKLFDFGVEMPSSREDSYV